MKTNRIQDILNEKATEHEAGGGAVVALLVNGEEVKVCLDEHGKACDAYSEALLNIHPLKP